jgi:replicative DNA helicase
MTTAFTTAAELFGSWFAEVERGEPPAKFKLTEPFAALDLRPGREIMIGGAPGSGKTAAELQIGVDLLRMNDEARLLIANVEMAPSMLVERIVSRMSGVPISAISDRMLSPEQLALVQAAVRSLAPISGRLAFLQQPYSLENVAASGTEFGANALVIDYVQRFSVGDGPKPERERLEIAADVIRRFCDEGAVVLVLAAVSRQRGQTGSNYSGLNLASFRGSSELEYGADAAYLIVPGEDTTILQCDKNRYGPVADIATRFVPEIQTFLPVLSDSVGANSTTHSKSKKAKGV